MNLVGVGGLHILSEPAPPLVLLIINIAKRTHLPPSYTTKKTKRSLLSSVSLNVM